MPIVCCMKQSLVTSRDAIALTTAVCLLLAGLLLPGPCALVESALAAEAGDDAVFETEKAYRRMKEAHIEATPEEVVAAASRIFALADVDYEIASGRGAVLACRSTTLTGEGTGTWYVQATPEGDGCRVMVRFGPGEEVNMPGDDIAGKWRLPKDWINPDPLRPAELEDGPALYTVFFKRMEYLLGENRYWLDCLTAEKYVRMERLDGELDAFCSFADDVDPGR